MVFGKAGGFAVAIELSALSGGTGFKIRGSGVDTRTGIAVAGAGDVNGDGFSDVIVGALLDDEGGNNAGAAFVVYGKATFAAPVELSTLVGADGFKIVGAAASDSAGTAVAGAGDVNGDGFADVIVGANQASVNGSHAGAAYVIFGGRSAFPNKVLLKTLSEFDGFTIRGSVKDESLGQTVSTAGDLNGDGFADVLIGAPPAKSNGNNFAGASYVIYGRAGGFAATYKSSAINGADGFTINGAAAFDLAGSSVAGGGDVNGDGYDDLLIGAQGVGSFPPTRPGLVHVVFGSASGFSSPLNLSTLNGTNGFTISGETPGDGAARVRFAGDVNGDGFDDVIIGAISNVAGGVRSGAAYVIFGKESGFGITFPLGSLTGANGFKLNGVGAYDYAGTSVGGGVDVNGDGFDDILIGASEADPSGKSNAGQLYVVFGTDTGAVTHPGDGGANTLTGDAGANVIIGGQAADTLIGNGGIDALRGGEGNDLLAVSDLTFRRVDGGLGTDTLRLDGAGLFIDLTAPAHAKLHGIERIDLTGSGANTLTLNVREVLDLSPTSNTLTVLGDAGDAVNFGAGWSLFGQETIGGTVFDVFVAGAATLKVASAVTTPVPSGLHPNALDGTRGITITGATGSQFARSLTSAGDVNGDGFDDMIAGAYAAGFPGGAGAAYVIFGKAGGLPTNLDVASLDGTNGFRITGTPATVTSFGRAVSGAGDVNGDGFADVIVGGFNESPNASKSGAAFVIFGQAGGFAGSVSVTELNSPGKLRGFKMSGNVYRENVGAAVGSAGDVNGDGFDDVIVGAGGADFGGTNAGAAYVVFGKADGFATNIQLAAMTGADGFRISGVEAKSYLGSSVNSAGDLNGDGFDDIVVGSIGSAAGGKYSGVAYVIFGKSTFGVEVKAGTGGFRIKGAAPGDSLGFGAGSAGDVNGDGFSDLVVGAFNSNANGTRSGAAYVIFGRTASFGTDFSLASLDGSNGFRLLGKPGDVAGYAASTAGDVNGDGFDDVIIGASGGGFSGAAFGNSYVVYGKAGFAADFDLGTVDGANGFKLVRAQAGDGSGSAVSNAGDVNGDGFDDVLVGAPFGNPSVAYLVYGSDSGAVTLPGDANANTLTGDGGVNVIVGGRANDTLIGNGGADAFRGGQGDDLIAVSDLTFLRVAGGTGIDTLRLDGSGLALNLAHLAGTKIHGIERIDLTGSGNNTLTLNVREVFNLSPTSNTLTVLGNAGDFVNFGAGWVHEVDQTIGGAPFHIFTNGAATLQIAAAVGNSLASGYVLPLFGNELPGLTINGVAAGDGARIVGSAGDVNGDGFDDFLVAAPNAAPNGANSGAAYVVFGKAGSFTSPLELSSLDGSNGFAIRGESVNNFVSFSLSAAGDFNGDGFGDIIVGSLNTNGAANQSGTAYLIYGKGTPFAPAFELSALDGTNGFKLRATAFSSLSFLSVDSAGDVNGDGFDDVVIGAKDVTTGALTQKGAASVVFGRATSPGASLDLATLNGANGFTITGTTKFESVGISVSGGDVNGDGFSDVIVGAFFAGKTYVVFGKAAGFAPTLAVSALDGANGFIIDGSSLSASAGQSVSAAGDVNGDGLGDLLIGAPNAKDASGTTGAAFVVFGKFGNTFGKTVNLAALNGSNGFRINGHDAGPSGEYAGESVSAAGDVNGDGFDDVIVGAAFASSRGTQTGEAYVIYGRGSGFAPVFDTAALDGTNGFSLVGTSVFARAARSISNAGDVNGDGFDDVLVGSYGPSGAAGRSFLVFGFDSGKVTQQGGPGNDTLTGDDGVNVFVGGQGNDTILNAGSFDVLRGGQGDDIFSGGDFTKGRLQRLVGGHGFDTIVLNGNTLLSLTARPVYRITGFEQVDLRPGVNYLSLDARAVVNASPDSNTLIVRADPNDFLNIGPIGPGGWIAAGTEVFDGETLTVLKQGEATLKVSPYFAPVVTLVDATTATYTDVDGDLVTIKTSKGTLALSDFFLFNSGAVGGKQLAAISLRAEFQNSDLTITAARTALGGDGRVNVGRIDATGVDLGKVSVEGDLGSIAAGDANLTAGLTSLTVLSMGRFGPSTQGAGGLGFSYVTGKLGALNIASDLITNFNVNAGLGGDAIGTAKIGGSILPTADGLGYLVAFGNIGSIAIGQDIRGGTGIGSGSVSATGNIGSITIGGSLVGGTGYGSGAVTLNGALGPVIVGGDLDGGRVWALGGIGSLAVTGSVLNAEILSGYTAGRTPRNADATIGAVTVGGDWVGSNLVAGAQTSDAYFGNGGDALISSGMPSVPGGDPAKIAKITSIAITGEVLGTPGGTDHFGFVAEEIGSFSVGGTKFPLTKGASNDLVGLRVGATIDVKVREVNATAPPVETPFTGTNGTSPAIASPLSLGSLTGTNGFQLNGTTTHDRAGFSVHSAGDVNGDGFDDMIIGATGIDGGSSFDGAGGAFVVFGTTDGFSAALDLSTLDGTNGFKLVGVPPEQAGKSVGSADVNGDGLSDVIVGTSRSGAYVVFGKASAFAAATSLATLNGKTGFKITGQAFGALGFSVSGAGDINGDGVEDVVIGDYRGQTSATSIEGAAYVVFGKRTAFTATLDVANLTGTNGFKLTGAAKGDRAGVGVSDAGDVNGDGIADLIVGASEADPHGEASGKAYVIYGKRTAFAKTISLGSINGANGFALNGVAAVDQTGYSVSGAGDVNGDGFDDVIIGQRDDGPPFTFAGHAYVVFGKATNSTAAIELSALNGTNGFRLDGNGAYSHAGISVSNAGDVNGDGFADLIVGAYGYNNYSGAAYIVYGKDTNFGSVIGLGGLSGTDGAKLLSASARDNAGHSVSSAGDLNGDGFADVIVGTIANKSYVVFGGGSGVPTAPQVELSADLKTATFTDVDGDLVTVKTSAGEFVQGDFTLVRAGKVRGAQVQTLDLSGPTHDAFAGANLTISATRGPKGGDGYVNVGALLATAHDLGKVVIDGDLGQLDAGNGDPLKPAVTSLTVHSLGRFGLSTQAAAGASLESNIKGKLGAFTVKSDLIGAFVNIDGSANDGDDDSGAITIGGSLRGGTTANSGSIFAAGDLGAVKIGGSLLAGAGPHSGSIEAGAKIASVSIGDSLFGTAAVGSGSLIAGTTLGATAIGGDLSGGRIFVKGNLLPTSDALALAIKSLSIAGNVSRADIFAGYDRDGAAKNADVQIGAVSVGRDWIASDLVAGLRPIDANFGNGDELIPGGNGITSKIASIVIGGQVLGTPSTISGTDHFGFVAEEIGAFSIGGTVFKLTPGALTDLAGLPVGATGDMLVREDQ